MTQFSEIPSVAHFAIISETSVYIPGDERSRTNPGHGYPEHRETFITYRAFTDRKEWEAAIAEATHRRQTFRAVSVTPATVTVTVNVNDTR
jgi:hypothetical protein